MRRIAALALAALALASGSPTVEAATVGRLRQPGLQAALNPQPLPPGPDRSGPGFRGQPGQRQMLNPQPLPPRQLLRPR
jgi:hypothetical protein